MEFKTLDLKSVFENVLFWDRQVQEVLDHLYMNCIGHFRNDTSSNSFLYY